MRKHFTEERCDLNLVLKDELSLNKLGGSDSKVSAYNVGDLGLIPGSGRSLWRRARQPTTVFSPGKIPWVEEPGRLKSMGSQRVRHD